MTIYNDGDGNAYLYYSWNYNWDTFWMHGGDDTVYAPSAVTKNLLFWGDGGNDRFLGSIGNDTAHGGADNDVLMGGGGRDTLLGDGGNDRIVGHEGGDQITGGLGADTMVGGNSGMDYFHYSRGESPAVAGRSDVIEDWNRSHMMLDTDIAGTPSNFAQAYMNPLFFNLNMDHARYLVEHDNNLRNYDHVFVYDGTNGFLVSDLNRDYTFETGVMLTGAGHAGNVGWNDIV